MKEGKIVCKKTNITLQNEMPDATGGEKRKATKRSKEGKTDSTAPPKKNPKIQPPTKRNIFVG